MASPEKNKGWETQTLKRSWQRSSVTEAKKEKKKNVSQKSRHGQTLHVEFEKAIKAKGMGWRKWERPSALERRRRLPRRGRDRGCGSRNRLLGQGQLLARQGRLPPVNGAENGEMEGSAENIEGRGSELEVTGVLSPNPLCSFCYFLAGKQSWACYHMRCFCGFPTRWPSALWRGWRGRGWQLPMNVSAWLGVAPRSFGTSVSPQLPARLCAALEPSRFLRACVPCQEVYGTFGKTTGILSLTSVSWQ